MTKNCGLRWHTNWDTFGFSRIDHICKQNVWRTRLHSASRIGRLSKGYTRNSGRMKERPVCPSISYSGSDPTKCNILELFRSSLEKPWTKVRHVQSSVVYFCGSA